LAHVQLAAPAGSPGFFHISAHQTFCLQPVLLQGVSLSLAKDICICLCWIPEVPTLIPLVSLCASECQPCTWAYQSAAFTVPSYLQTWLEFTLWSTSNHC